jgi:hypothetical protein
MPMAVNISVSRRSILPNKACIIIYFLISSSKSKYIKDSDCELDEYGEPHF